MLYYSSYSYDSPLDVRIMYYAMSLPSRTREGQCHSSDTETRLICTFLLSWDSKPPKCVPGGGGVRLRHAATNVPCCGSRQRPAVRQEPGLPTKGQHGSARPCKCQQSGSGRSRSHHKKILIPARRYHSSLIHSLKL